MSSSDILPSLSSKSLLKDPQRVRSPTSGRRVSFDSKAKRTPIDFSKLQITAPTFGLGNGIPGSIFSPTTNLPPLQLPSVNNPTPLPPIDPSPEEAPLPQVDSSPIPILPPVEESPPIISPILPPISAPLPISPPVEIQPISPAQVLPAQLPPIEVRPVSPTRTAPTLLPAQLPPIEVRPVSPTPASHTRTAPTLLPAQLPSIEVRPTAPPRMLPSMQPQSTPISASIQWVGSVKDESQLFGNGMEFNEPEPQPEIPATLYRSSPVQYVPNENVMVNTQVIPGMILVNDSPRILTPPVMNVCSSDSDDLSFGYSQRAGSPQMSPPGSPSLPCPTSPSRPISPVCKNDDINLITGECFETILRSYGYTPMLKLIIERQGKLQGEYIKCLDRLGNYVYVRLDTTGGYISVNNQDLVIEQTREVSEIPYSTLHTFKDESFMILHGVAIHCKRGICFVRRHHDGSIKTDHYLYSRVTHRDSPKPPSPSCVLDVMDSSLLSFPVVNMSEIKANIVDVITNTDNLSVRLANHTYKQCMFECQKLEESLSNLAKACEEFKRCSREISEKMKHSTHSYRIKIRDSLTVKSRRDGNFVKTHSLNLYNLQRRQELMSEFLHGARAAGFLADQNLESATRDIRELVKYMQITFANVDSELRP